MTSIEITVLKGIFRSSGSSSPVVTSQTKKRPGFPPRPIGDGYALPRCVDAVNVVALAGQIFAVKPLPQPTSRIGEPSAGSSRSMYLQRSSW